jgi:hypothetical protein
MNLTSLLAISSLPSPTKRKAQAYDSDSENSENIDPVIFLSPKRSKCPDGSSKATSSPLCKPQNFFVTRAPPSPNDFSSAIKPVTSPRKILSARSPAAPRIDPSKTTPLSAPAGRSPTRKRVGILNRRRTTASPFTRVDPPKFSGSSTSHGLGFSIDAALSGTIPSYTPRSVSKPLDATSAKEIPVLHTPSAKPSWFFAIHEDTEEELATNLMEHSTCTLDISSDEESASRQHDNRGKENVPPPDDVSQTRTILAGDVVMGREAEMESVKARVKALRRKRDLDSDAIDIDRSPLSDLAAEDFYAEGCDGSSNFIIPAELCDEVEVEAEHNESYEQVGAPEISEEAAYQVEMENKLDLEIDALMQKSPFATAPKAALLEPIEKAEVGFEVWESGSAKGDEE